MLELCSLYQAPYPLGKKWGVWESCIQKVTRGYRLAWRFPGVHWRW